MFCSLSAASERSILPADCAYQRELGLSRQTRGLPVTSHRDSCAVSAGTTASGLAERCGTDSKAAAGSSNWLLASACVPLPGPRHAGAALAAMCAPTDAAESSQQILAEAAPAPQCQQLSVDEATGAVQPALAGAAPPAQQDEQLPTREVMAEPPAAPPPCEAAAVPADLAASTGT